MPLGDALTIIFTEPLFTIAFSLILLKISVGIIKLMLCIGLLCGMMLSIQPPFIFGPKENNSISTLGENETRNSDDQIIIKEEISYYTGVMMAITCAIFGSLCNILINKCDQTRSTVLVFYAGISGIMVSILGSYIRYGFKLGLNNNNFWSQAFQTLIQSQNLTFFTKKIVNYEAILLQN